MSNPHKSKRNEPKFNLDINALVRRGVPEEQIREFIILLPSNREDEKVVAEHPKEKKAVHNSIFEHSYSLEQLLELEKAGILSLLRPKERKA
ncbi:MAG: hypothetical protein ACP5M9_00050 [Candidatus Micrarchaeia archaeon]